MKTAKSIVVVLFVLLTAQIASAYYCPSTGRWLSRDPIGEPGFQALQTASSTSGIGNSVLQPSGRWVNRDSSEPTANIDIQYQWLLHIGVESDDAYNIATAPPSANQYISCANSLIGFNDLLGLWCGQSLSGPYSYSSNLILHQVGGAASSITFRIFCPKCAPNLMRYQIGYQGSPPTGTTGHGHTFPDSFSTRTLTSSPDSIGVTYMLTINVTSTMTLQNYFNDMIKNIFVVAQCCNEQGPPYRLPGLHR